MTEQRKTEFDSTALRYALANVEPHASRDDTLPTLAAVRWEFDGAQLTLITTDRYTLATDIVPALEQGGEPFAFLLAVADVPKVLSLLKGAPKHVSAWPVSVAVMAEPETYVRVVLTVLGDSITLTTVDGEFPRWRTVLDGAVEKCLSGSGSVPHICLDPQLLAKFAKVTDGGRKCQAMRMHFQAPNKATVIELGKTFRGVIMPQRREWPAHVEAVTPKSMAS